MDKNNDMTDKGLANEIKGSVKETVGKVRGDLGDALDNSSEHIKGRAQQAEGNVQKNFGKAEQKIDEKMNKHDTAYIDEARRSSNRRSTMTKPAQSNCSGPAIRLCSLTDYSYRSATIGSRLAARRAGHTPNTTPTSAENTKRRTDGADRDVGVPVQPVSHAHRGAGADHDADDAAEHAEHDRLDEELREDVAARRAERLADARPRACAR